MQEPVTISIIALTVMISFWGFRDHAFVEKFIFSPAAILRDKQGYRLITSGFLHADWPHLAFNMYSLYSFGRNLETYYGPATLLAIYLSSILGGNLLSLFLHRNHVYKAYGASGGVCGVIFASIFLLRGDIRMLMLPIPIPTWLYAILFLLGSFYGIKKSADNIGHDAHLGGAIIGLVVTTMIYPGIISAQPYLYSAVMILSLVLLIVLIKNPMFLPLHASTRSSSPPRSPPKTPLTRDQQARQVNAILEKISRSGMDSLTREEHQLLLDASQKGKAS
ncbi:MAG: rhomboid family protein [Pedosphaera sp.]|nr:rhomboid family protein [Pedosphaera sp.]